MTELKNSFQQREAKLNKQIETTRAEADRELCDLRRQLNRVQDSHVEFMEQVEKKHAEELSINFKFLRLQFKHILHLFELCTTQSSADPPSRRIRKP
jgi:hypothetical protein